MDLSALKTKLLDGGMPEDEAKKFLGYVAGARRDEERKKDNQRPVTGNTIDMLYGMAIKYWNMGLVIDGTNIVITGRNMAMVTYHGYKNKVLQVYPETEFDVGLVREGDTFSAANESGSIIYSHTIADPFDTESKPIIGAYVVFKNKRGEYMERLNKADFEKMKKGSKQTYLWGEWESEFWLKSVIKRACKRHFNDIVAEIDKNDNDDYGMLIDKNAPVATDKEDEVKVAIEVIEKATTLDELKSAFLGLTTFGLNTDKRVIAAKDKKKAELTETDHEDN